MRDLTDAEVRVLKALLAAGQENERERLRWTQLPRSTYHAVRKRAYAEGWLHDRYVPDPLLFGFNQATIALARPYADKTEEVASLWAADPGTVVLWKAPTLLFAVLFHTDASRAAQSSSRLKRSELLSEVLLLSGSWKELGVPVYFDYEGLFGNLAGLSGTISYPRGLGGPSSVGARRGSPISSEGLRRSAWELVSRPVSGGEGGRPGHLMGPVGLPRSQRRLVEQGWVERRVLPDPSKVPPYQGRAADQVVFVRGEFLPGRSAEALLPVLSEQCRVYPFLVVAREGKLLLGAMGQAPGTSSDAVATVPTRRPVLPTLQEHLQSIEVSQVRAAEVAAVVDHRYDRLLAPQGRPAG